MEKRVKAIFGNPLGILLAVLVFARIVPILTLPLEGLLGYGDVQQYFNLAAIPGWPYLNHWSEYPPLFPLLLEILHGLAGGKLHVFAFLFVFGLLACDVANLFFFYRITNRLTGFDAGLVKTLGYLVVLCVFPYHWWYFDPLVVLCVLVVINYAQEQKTFRVGAALMAGALLKFFPLILLVKFWRSWPKRSAVTITVLPLLGLGLVYGAFTMISPEYTTASLASQASKGSWQTIWALVDGNLQTGNFGPLIERLDASKAFAPVGNPPVISPWITLISLAAIGFWRFIKSNPKSELSMLALAGFAWTIFFIWSPGWSPQWILYLIPLILLVLPLRTGALFIGLLIFVNILEWPVLLSRGYFFALPMTILLRTLVLILLAITFDKFMRNPDGSIVTI